jgi:hypothetical protein
MSGKQGRPSKFNPDMIRQVELLCRKGFTDAELAEFFQVNQQTIDNWKVKHPSFFGSLKAGKDANDDKVESSLLKRAMGFTRTVERLHEGCPVACMEEVPPDTTAGIFWLKNRRPAQWRDRQEHELSGPGGQPITPVINLTIGAPPGHEKK